MGDRKIDRGKKEFHRGIAKKKSRRFANSFIY